MIAAPENHDGLPVTSKARSVTRLVCCSHRDQIRELQRCRDVLQESGIAISIPRGSDKQGAWGCLHRIDNRLFPDSEEGQGLLFTLFRGLIRFRLGEPLFEFRRLITPT